jgi:hypothetical protein
MEASRIDRATHLNDPWLSISLAARLVRENCRPSHKVYLDAKVNLRRSVKNNIMYKRNR